MLAFAIALTLSACSSSTGSGDDEGPGGGWGTPELTFSLLVPAGEKPTLYYPDLVTRFPEVNWSKLDRPYIAAGAYRTVLLGGLPQRSASRPLVITNHGGQVRVGGEAGNYVFVILGGKSFRMRRSRSQHVTNGGRSEDDLGCRESSTEQLSTLALDQTVSGGGSGAFGNIPFERLQRRGRLVRLVRHS